MTVRDGILFGDDDRVCAWIAERIPGYQRRTHAQGIGVLRGDDIVAAVVFENWNGIHCEMSVAADPGSGWLTRNLARVCFHHAFHTLGCVAVSGVVAMSNADSISLATRMGCFPEAIVKFAAHDGSDLVILKMLREECRWIRNGTVWEGGESPEGAGSSPDGSG